MSIDLTTEWIEALGLVKTVLGTKEIARILSRTAVRWASPTECSSIGIATYTWKQATAETERMSIICINPRLEKLYKTERIEVLMYLAVQSWQYLTAAPIASIIGLCKALGVHESQALNPKQRWHYLSNTYHHGNVLASAYEDRPVCPTCRIHVSTGHQNPKIHDGCVEYVRNVYAPALARQAKIPRASTPEEANP